VPLSEHEQRLLEQMERALYAEDPKFVSALRGSTLRVRYRRRALLAVVGFIVGVVLLMTGLVTQVLAVSIVGFVVMLATAFLGITAWRGINGPADLSVAGQPARPTGARARARGRGPRGRGAKPGFMARMEQRWERRRDERGF
jgi:hypothetical protein